MELQLGELFDELAGRLPEGSFQALDELAEQLDEVETRLEGLRVRPLDGTLLLPLRGVGGGMV